MIILITDGAFNREHDPLGQAADLIERFRADNIVCYGIFIRSQPVPDLERRLCEESGDYKVPPIFFPCPSSTGNKAWAVPNFGPVGIGITLKPAGGSFQMIISNVEKGSPAEATGKLKKGQIIESINGMVLKDKDPRIILGDLITEAEATDGKDRVADQRRRQVVVTIPVMGRYSDTWPVDCAKSDRIVRELADRWPSRTSPPGVRCCSCFRPVRRKTWKWCGSG
jgi:hypothetical protein